MLAEPLQDAVITPHAEFQIIRRGLTIQQIRRILSAPEQRLEQRPGRTVLQSRVALGQRSYLVRVIVDVDRQPPEVVTAYRTSKIEKYWRKNR